MDIYIDPTKERFALFKDLPRIGEIHMLNLVRLREHAVYPDGATSTGEEAYEAYSRESEPVFQGVGGKLVWSASFEFMTIGPAAERWDKCFVASYPSAQAFIDMLRDPVYREAVKHRQAAVETSRLVRTRPKDLSAGFG